MGEKQVKQSPPKLARFIVWACAKPELREDVLVAFDEMHADALAKFGPGYAWVYSSSQAVRSIPFGVRVLALRAVAYISHLAS